MLVVCAWCIAVNEPGFLREIAPYTDTSLTHGVCAQHADQMRRERAALAEGQASHG